jgi:hypothetical protein
MKNGLILPVVAVLCAGGCSSGAAVTDQPIPGAPVEACISSGSARFVFPPEPRQEYVWDEAREGKYDGLPEFSWEVYWELPGEERGKRPHALWLVTYWSAGGPRRGTLTQMLAQVAPTVMTEDTTASEQVSIAREDPAVTVVLEGNRVALRVQGQEAIGRIFPFVPDSVRMYRQLGADSEDKEFLVRVRQDERSCGPPA